MTDGANVAGSRRVQRAHWRLYLPLIFRRGGSVWRAVSLSIVAAATILWANTAMAQYPIGGRNDDRWYYCWTSGSGGWGDIDSSTNLLQPGCEPIGWHHQGTGNYDSQLFEAAVTAGGELGADSWSTVRGYIVPPDGVKKYTYSCNTLVSRCFAPGTGGQSHGIASTNGSGSNPFNNDGTGWQHGHPTNIVADMCFANTLNVVGTWRASQQDNFSSLEPVSTWSTNNNSYPQFRVEAGSSNEDRQIVASYSCRIIEWEMWPDVDPWEPGDEDLPPATPTPISPGFPTWDVTPLVPVSNTVDIVIGTPGEPECVTIVPSGGISQTVFGYEIDSGWADYEVCTQAVELGFEYFDIDFGSYILLAIGVLSLGAVYKFFRTG